MKEEDKGFVFGFEVGVGSGWFSRESVGWLVGWAWADCEHVGIRGFICEAS